MAIEIRIVTGDELTLYRSIRLQALKESPQAFGSDYEESKSRPTMSRILDSNEGGFLLGAFDEDRLVGIVSLRRLVGKKTGHKCEINQMYVSPEDRGKGIGRQLMLVLIGKAEELGDVEALTLSVVTINVAAT